MKKFKKSSIFKNLCAMLALSTALMSTAVYADDNLPVWSGGDGTYTRDELLKVGTWTGNGRTITEWLSYCIGQGYTMNMIMTGENAVNLSRIVGEDPSRIFGMLNVTGGKLYLINKNGIIFGAGSQVNASAGLVASTLDMRNEDFLAGHYKFTQSGLNPGLVQNDGTITSGGSVALLGGAVHNNGLIVANESNITLASGKEMTLSFDPQGLLSVAVDKGVTEKVKDLNGQDIKDGTLNTGIVRANGGTVVMTTEAANDIFANLVNNRGLIEANSVGSKEGKVVLISQHSQGVVQNTGTINVRGNDAGEKGGRVEISGEKVGLFDGTRIDASGQAGGGTVLVGGDYRGEGSLRNADYTILSADAIVTADALYSGNGGKIIFWSNNATQIFGDISAQGGVAGGDGGFVETSSHDYLSVDEIASVNVAAGINMGKGGIWLLDPRNVTIANAASSGGGFSGGDPNVFTPTSNNAIVSRNTIQTSLNNGTNVTVTTGSTGSQSGNITVQDSITKSAGGPCTLLLLAANDISVNAFITSTSGVLNVTFTAGGNVAVNSSITTNGGAFTTTGNDLDINAAITTAGGAISATHTGDITVSNLLSTGSGNILLSTAGDVTFNGANADVTSTGVLTVNADNNTNGSGNFVQNNAGSAINAGSVNITAANYQSSAGTINASTGDVTINASTNNAQIGIGDNTRDLNLSDDELDRITVAAGNKVAIGNATNTGGIFVGTSEALTQGSKNFELTTAGTTTFQNNSFTTTGNVTSTSNDIVVNSALNANNVTLKANDNTDLIGVGSGAGTYNVNNTDLSNIHATGLLAIGDAANTAGINVDTITSNNALKFITGGNINLYNTLKTAGKAIEFAGNVLLNTNTSIDTTNGGVVATGANVLFDNAVNALTAGNQGLTITAGTAGVVTFISTAGLGAALSNIALTAASIVLNAVKTTGSQTYNGNASLGGNLTSTAAGSITVNGNTTLTDNVTIQTAGTASTDDINLNGTVNGTKALVLNAGSGDVSVTGAAGGTTQLQSMSATGNTVSVKDVKTAASQSYNGSTTLNGNYLLTGAGQFTVNGNTTLGGNTSVATAGGASDHIALNGTVNGTQDLSLNAGTGHVTITGAAGQINALNSFTATASQITVNAIKSLGNQLFNGNTTLNGDLQTTTAGSSVNVNGNLTVGDVDGDAVTVDTVKITTNNGNVAITGKTDGTQNYKQALEIHAGSGAVSFGDAIGSIVPLYGFLLDNTGSQVLPSVINAQNITFTTLNLASDMIINVGTGIITLGQVIANAFNLTLIGDEINFTGGANSVTGTGNLILQSFTDSLKLVVAGAAEFAGQLDLTVTDLLALANGWSSIQIGKSTASGGIDINTFTFNDPVKFMSPVAGAINVLGNIIGAGNASISIFGSGATTHLFANIITAGTNILIDDSVVVEGGNILLDTTNGGGVATGANVQITGQVNGASSGANNFALNAGTNGDITLNNAVGNTVRLGDLKFERANNLTATDLTAKSISTGATGITGTANFNGKLNTNGAAGVDLNGNVINLNDSVTTTNNGTVTLTNTGTLSINGAVNSDGAVLQDGAGAVNLGNNITTTADDVTFAAPVTLTTNVEVNTGAGIGNITFNNTVDSDATARNLTLRAGAGNVALNNKVGNTSALDAFVITDAENVTAADSITARTITQNAGTGTSTFQALITSGAAGIILKGVNFILNGAVTTTGNGGVAITNAGSLQVNGVVNSDGAFVQDGAGVVTLNNNITTTGDLVSFLAPVVLGVANVTINSNGGTINFSNTINGTADGANGLTLMAGTGNIVCSGAIGLAVGKRLADLIIVSANNASFGSTIKAKTIEQQAGTGTTTFDGMLDTSDVNGSGNGIELHGTNFNFNDLVITQNGGNFVLDNAGLAIINANADMVLDGQFKQTGGGDIATAGDITTTGDSISFAGIVNLIGNVSFDTTNGSAAGADINFNNDILALNSGVQKLNLNAGNSGNIAFNANVGSLAQRLGDLTITNANNVTATGNITAASLRQISGQGTTTFNGTVDTNTATGIDLTGNAFTFNGNVTTTNNGGVNVTNSGDFNINSTLNLDGAFLQDGTGDNFLNGNINTTGDQVTYTSGVELTGDSSIDTTVGGFPAGAGVTFVSTLDGANNLTLQTGSSSILFNGAIGSNTALGSGTGAAINVLSTGGTTTFNSTVDTDSGIITNNDTIFNDDVNLGDGDTVTELRKNVTFNTGLGGKSFSAFDGAKFGTLFQNHQTTVNGALLTITSSNGDLLFNSFVDGPANLKLDAGSGTTTFKEKVGSNSKIGTGAGAAITIASSGNTIFEKTVEANSGISASHDTGTVTFNGNVTLQNGNTGSNFDGNVNLNGIQFSGFDGVTFGNSATDQVTLNTGASSIITNNGNATFEAAVDGAQDLTVTAGTGNVDFKAGVGQNTALNNLTVTSATETRFGSSVTTTNNQNITSGTIKTNAKNESTNGNILFNGNLVLENDTKLITSAGNGSVTVTGTTNGNKALEVSTGNGNVDFQGNIGNTDAVNVLEVSAGTGTTHFGGNVSTVNEQKVVSANIQTNGIHSAISGAITFIGNVLLQNHTTFQTTGQNVFITGNIDGNKNLTFDTGAGNVVINGNVGAGTRIGQFLIQSVADFDLFGDIFANTMTQTSGTGTTFFHKGMDTDGAAGMNFTGNNFTFGDAPPNSYVTKTTNGGPLCVSHIGTLIINNTLSISGLFKDLGPGVTQVNGDITAAMIEFFGDVLFTSDLTKLTATAGDILFHGFVDGDNSDAQDEDIELSATGNIAFDKQVGLGNIAGSQTPFGDIKIVTANNVTFSDDIYVNKIQQVAGTGLTSFGGNVHTADATTGIDITTKDITFNDTVDVDNGGDAILNNSGVLTIANNKTWTLAGGDFKQVGNGTAFTGANLFTFGGSILWNDPTLTNDVTMDSAGGDITFNDHIDSDGTARNLTLTAGAGSINFNGTIGQTSALGDLLITSAGDVNVQQATTVNSFTQQDGTGTTVINGTVTTNGVNGAGNGFDFTGNNLNLNNVLTTLSNGNVEITNAGLFTTAGSGDIFSDGTFIQNGAGSNVLSGDIVTTDDFIFFQQQVTIANNVLMRTNLNTGNGITFASDVNSTADDTNQLTLDAGDSGNIQFTGAVGNNFYLQSILVQNAHDVTFNNTVRAGQITQNAGTGTTLFNQDAQTFDASGFDITTNDIQSNANVIATNGKIRYKAANNITAGNDAADKTQADLNIEMEAGNDITLNSTTESDADLAGAEGINMTAGHDIQANNTITSHGGNINMLAKNTINFLAVADVSSNNGNVRVIADSDGNNLGGINMEYLPTDAAVIDAGNGTIELSAGEDVNLGRLLTLNATNNAVKVTSTAGAIVDGGEGVNGISLFDIDARNGNVSLKAFNGIGAAAPNGALEIWTPSIDATTDHNNINVDLNDPLLGATTPSPVHVTNASVTGGAGDITMRQLNNSPMTVTNASTVNGAITFRSIADLIVDGTIQAHGPLAVVNLLANAPDGAPIDNLGDLIITGTGLVLSDGPIFLGGVNIFNGGTVITDSSIIIGQALADIFVGTMKANLVDLIAGRDILDNNGDNNNITANQANLSAGGVIGRFFDALDVVIHGDLTVSAHGIDNGISGVFHGSILGSLQIADLTPGLVLFNSIQHSGAPINRLINNGLANLFNLISTERPFLGMGDQNFIQGLKRGLLLKSGKEMPFKEDIGTARVASPVLVSERTTKLFRPVIAPVPQPVEQVTPTPTPVVPTPVTPTVPVAVKPEIPVVQPTPVVQPVQPVQPIAQQPLLQRPEPEFTPSVAPVSPLQPAGTFGPRALFQNQVEEKPASEKLSDNGWMAKVKDSMKSAKQWSRDQYHAAKGWFGERFQGQSMQPPAQSFRLFKGQVEEEKNKK